MKAEKISIEEAKKDKLFYFVANVVVYKNGKCLILKRSMKEKAHPGKWCVPGGKLEWKNLDMGKPTRMNGDIFDFEDTAENLLERETFEEAGIRIEKDLKYINNVAFIRPDGIPVILVKFAARYKSGDVKLEEDAFDDYTWVDAEEVKNYNCILGVHKEVKKTIELFEK